MLAHGHQLVPTKRYSNENVLKLRNYLQDKSRLDDAAEALCKKFRPGAFSEIDWALNVILERHTALKAIEELLVIGFAGISRL